SNLQATMASKIANVPKDKIFGEHITRLRRRISMFAALSAGVAVASLLALRFGLRATAEAKRALARQLTAEAELTAQSPNPANGYLDRAALFAVQAYRIREDAESMGGMLRVLTVQPQLHSFFFENGDYVQQIFFDRNGTTFLTLDSGRRLIYRHLKDRQ